MSTDYTLGSWRLDGWFPTLARSLITFTHSSQVIVLCLASAMKFRNWRKVLRFERWTAIEQVERGETIQRIQLNKDIPFGIKALEEEPAIEGVWNARTVTPLHTPPGSRGSSPRLGPSRLWLKDKRGSSVSSISGLDMEVPAQVSTLPSMHPRRAGFSEY